MRWSSCIRVCDKSNYAQPNQVTSLKRGREGKRERQCKKTNDLQKRRMYILIKCVICVFVDHIFGITHYFLWCPCIYSYGCR